MSDLHIDLLVADAVCAPDYQAALLDQADRARVSAAPALAMRTDWQVSRFLKQQAKAPGVSVSDSHGAAFWRPGLIRCRWAWTSNGCGHAILRRWRIYRAAPMSGNGWRCAAGVRQIITACGAPKKL